MDRSLERYLAFAGVPFSEEAREAPEKRRADSPNAPRLMSAIG
jgi:hypothetical protein